MQHDLFQNYQVEVLIGLLVLYSIPILSLILFPLNKWIKFCWVHSFLGHIEWVLSFLRDGLLAVLILISAIYLFVESFETGLSYHPFVLLFFVGLSVWNYLYRRNRVRKFAEFITGKFILDPSDFYKLYFASLSGFPGKFSVPPKKVLKFPIDYRSGGSGISIWPLLVGALDTAILTRLVVRALKWKGAEFCNRVADAVCAIWGARVIQLTHAGLEVEGLEKLKNVSGRTIFISNHKSFVDFTIVPLLTGVVNLEREKPFRVRFMAAKGHFRDNPFFYHVLGLGKAMEKAGTIFVDRKSKMKKATEAVGEAVAAMTKNNVDIIIYPQGTRATGNRDKNRKRFDAGYYTTGSKENLLKERGHIKKGVAYLATDVAASLAKQGKKLNIVPVGIVGTATIAPRGKLRIQKGVELKAVVGNPIVLSPEDFENIMGKDPSSEEYGEIRGALVESLFVKIDESLKAILRVHDGLKKRLLIDIRGMMREEDIDSFLEALKAWRDDEDLIFSIIDCIYSLSSKLWRSYLSRLAQLLVETDTSREKVIEFKGVVVGEMMKNR